MTYHVTGSIEGVAPILFNKPYTEPAGTKTEASRKATAIRERLYRGDKTKGIYIPAWTFKKMLCVDGAYRAGLKIKTTGLTQFLLAGLFLDGDPLFRLVDPEGRDGGPVQGEDFVHEVWGRVPPKKGAMVRIWRPGLLTGWHLFFGFTIIDELIAPEQVRQALDVAGLKVGLGGWRPEFGRFVVRNWEVAEVTEQIVA